jgi:hypothetical protein
MATYSYERSLNDLQLALARIEHDVGVAPTGISSGSGGLTTVEFAADLTAGQLTALNSLMAGASPDSVHASTGTVFRVRDLNRLRAFVRSQFGVSFAVYPDVGLGGEGYRLVFDVNLTAQQRNNFRDLWTQLLVLVSN